MATPHIEASKGEIAKTVIMSGDPLRAKYIAENYLKDYKLVNKVRNMFMYTGYYNGKEVTIASHGMGMPSAGIYFYELFNFYDVDTIIRIGTCGTSNKDIDLLQTILIDSSYTESNYAYMFNKEKISFEKADEELTNELDKIAHTKNKNILRGTIMTCDVFDPYVDWKAINERIPKDINVLGTEMEAFALFHIARVLNKKAACLATVVDSKYRTEVINSSDREKSLTDMIEISLEVL